MGLTIQDKLRCSSVDRWQIVRTLRTQNLAEHQWNVTIISVEIARSVLGDYFKSDDELRLMKYAMFHDTMEVMLGDICTPIKQRIKKACGYDVFKEIEGEIDSGIRDINIAMQDTVYQNIAKIADLVDGINFLSLEGHGRHSEEVLHKLKMVLMDYIAMCKFDYPQYIWENVSMLIDKILNDDAGFLRFENSIK